jgi:CTP synthase
MADKPKFIFITGGVLSSLGKGIASASLGALLQARGYKVRLRKFEPYINVDPGTMSPYQHGEVFVTDDGAETDLDLGHYERFTGVSARKSDIITTGQIYADVIARERRGEYLGATVQVIPHITDRIKEFISTDIGDEDFILYEVGGTVGDIEGLPFLEALRQFHNDVGRERSMFVHLTLLPYIPTAGELKTKPTQHSVKELRSLGIQPDILLCRSDRAIPDSERDKIALFCNVKGDNVIAARDVNNIYEVPISYHERGFDVQVLKHFGMGMGKKPDLTKWDAILEKMDHPEQEITIGIAGKYIVMKDAYKSLVEALTHGGIANQVKVNFKWIDTEELLNGSLKAELDDVDAVLVPGGFGERGAEGKIKVAEYARTHKIPYFGICYGMQMAILEAARNLGGMVDANSTEIEPGLKNPLIGLMTEWEKDGKVEKRSKDSDMGGTMRLGQYECHLEKDSKIHDIYGSDVIFERHRHRYEVNLDLLKTLNIPNLKITGLSPDGVLPETFEYTDHPWFIGVQYHPELKSRPLDIHPLFASFIKAAVAHSRLV